MSQQEQAVTDHVSTEMSSWLRRVRKRSIEPKTPAKRRFASEFHCSTCCKGVLAALIAIAIAIVVIISLIITLIAKKNKGTESTTTTSTVITPTFVSPTETTTVVTTTNSDTTIGTMIITTAQTTIYTTTATTTTTTTVLNIGWNPVGITVAGTGIVGQNATMLSNPVSLAVDSARSLYIADRVNDRVQKWLNGSSSGTTVAGSANGTTGSSLIYLNSPSDVEMDSSENVYIADTNNDRIMSYALGNLTGNLCIGGTGLGTTQLKYPTGACFDSLSNSLYIANTLANNIVRWLVGASNWILVAGSSSGAAGLSSMLLKYPRDLILDSMKNVYVADMNNSRIQFFPAGQFNGTTIAGSANGTTGNSATLFSGPIGLAVDSNFNLYVADYHNNRIQRFDHY